MPLEDEILDALNQAVEKTTRVVVQRGRAAGQSGLSVDDRLEIQEDVIGELRAAILRLARELDRRDRP